MDGTLQRAGLAAPSVGGRATARTARPGLAGSLVFLMALLAASVGLTWDIQWHVWVGRDTFWSPPHLLLYAGVTVAGLLCFGQVAAAWRQGVRPARGYLIGAVGMFITLLAAPFDDLWHRLYGIDVDLWAPAHLLGLIGALIASLGLIDVWAELRGPAPRRRWGGVTWGLLLALSGVLTHLLTMAQPAFNRYPTLDIGPLRLLSLPILQTAALALVLVYAVRLIGLPNAALALFGLYWLRQTLVAVLVPGLVHVTVAAQGLSFRAPGGPPIGPAVVLSPLLLLPTALAVAAAGWIGWRWPARRWAALAGLLVAATQLALAPPIIGLADSARGAIALAAPELVGRVGAGQAALSAWPAAAPVALLAGVLLALAAERWAAGRAGGTRPTPVSSPAVASVAPPPAQP